MHCLHSTTNSGIFSSHSIALNRVKANIQWKKEIETTQKYTHAHTHTHAFTPSTDTMKRNSTIFVNNILQTNVAHCRSDATRMIFDQFDSVCHQSHLVQAKPPHLHSHAIKSIWSVQRWRRYSLPARNFANPVMAAGEKEPISPDWPHVARRQAPPRQNIFHFLAHQFWFWSNERCERIIYQGPQQSRRKKGIFEYSPEMRVGWKGRACI